jgi:hypothetical protein
MGNLRADSNHCDLGEYLTKTTSPLRHATTPMSKRRRYADDAPLESFFALQVQNPGT